MLNETGSTLNLNTHTSLRSKTTLQEVKLSERPFTLDEEFIADYVNQTPKWGPVGYITYKRTYSRSLETISDRHAELGRKYGLTTSEEWWLTVCRVVEGTYQIQQRHCRAMKLHWRMDKAQRSAQEMFRLIFNFKFTPPGRGLWMMGTPYVERAGGAALNNCAFTSTIAIDKDFSGPFTFLMDMSMLGVGVGFDTLGAGKVTIVQPEVSDDVHVVEDSREGWVELIARTLEAFVGNGSLPKERDYSKVRLYGALIKGFGGTAAGPDPLAECYMYLTTLLYARVGETIRVSDIVDIANMIGRCVVAGNVRRSAELSIGSHDDQEFLNLKNRELWPVACDNWRWASNNSISAIVGMDYSNAAKLTAENGDPGYVWLENARNYGRMGRAPDFKDLRVMGVNPCSEQSLEDRELCCLAEVFPSNHDTYEELERTLKFVYLYTKTVTLVPTHNAQTNAVMLNNRRIGVSMTGIVQAMAKFGRRAFLDMCDKGYSHLRYRDDQYSRWLCIPKSIKITSVKPSGSVSLLPGVTPGIHFPHSEYYMRVIRFAADSPLVDKLRVAGYRCYDLAPAEPNTIGVYFPVKEAYFERSKEDVSLMEQFEMAAQMQEYWADNQVSITVNFKRTKEVDGVVVKGEEGQIKYALELYEKRLKGVSLLPHDEHGYSHAPYQTIDKETYETYAAGLNPIDYTGSVNEVVDKFCDGDVCAVRIPS